MTVLEVLAILEAAVLERKKMDINTPEVKDALNLLEPYISRKWLVPQCRQEASDSYGNNDVDPEGQQQVLHATFPGIRDAVRVLLEVRMDSLARKFHETHDMKVKDEINRLGRELIKLNQP